MNLQQLETEFAAFRDELDRQAAALASSQARWTAGHLQQSARLERLRRRMQGWQPWLHVVSTDC